MVIGKVNKCPVCGSKNLRKFRKAYICKDCGAKIGMVNGKIWYEYSINSYAKDNNGNNDDNSKN